MDPILGQLLMFAGNFAPRGWALCDGQLLPISSNSALFSILGTTYGGDGRTTFALPDLRGRVPIHPGSGAGLSAYRLGQKGGTETVTLTVNQIPAHHHTIAASQEEGTTDEAENAFLANSSSQPYSTAADGQLNPSAVGNTGGNQAHSNIQPYGCVNYIICLQGVYPSRN